ncbi:MAG: lipocalin [Gammaproteobacteria bacterium BRH_c0]|nr:MAG: lipocalin [Gammaproteobacteria bacterium BRH_c0]
MTSQFTRSLALLVALALGACSHHVPEGVQPVSDFELERYLGTWYEIARLDHRFERGLSDVTAHYSLRDDGGLRVINRGYSAASGEWEEAEGKAYFVEDSTIGHLKVSFFGPFYGAYIVFDLDHEAYSQALVSGPDKSYLWILARTPTLDPGQLEALVARAKASGFDTDALIFVSHDNPAASPGNSPQP